MRRQRDDDKQGTDSRERRTMRTDNPAKTMAALNEDLGMAEYATFLRGDDHPPYWPGWEEEHPFAIMVRGWPSPLWAIEADGGGEGCVLKWAERLGHCAGQGGWSKSDLEEILVDFPHYTTDCSAGLYRALFLFIESALRSANSDGIAAAELALRHIRQLGARLNHRFVLDLLREPPSAEQFTGTLADIAMDEEPAELWSGVVLAPLFIALSNWHEARMKEKRCGLPFIPAHAVAEMHREMFERSRARDDHRRCASPRKTRRCDNDRE